LADFVTFLQSRGRIPALIRVFVFETVTEIRDAPAGCDEPAVVIAALRRSVNAVRHERRLAVSEQALVSLAIEGVRRAAAEQGTSERSLRREIRRVGLAPIELARELKRAVLAELHGQVSDSTLASVLGYANVPSLQRFMRSAFGTRVRQLKRQARESS